MSELLAIIAACVGVGIMIVGLAVAASNSEEAEKTRKHISYPRRRFLRKQARKAHVS